MCQNPQIEECTVFCGFFYDSCWPWNTPEYKDIPFVRLFQQYASLVIAKFWGCYMDEFMHSLCLTMHIDRQLDNLWYIPTNCRRIAPGSLPSQKSTKIERKTAYKLSSIRRRYYRYREKSRQGPTRYRVFLQRKYLDSIWEHSELLSRWKAFFAI